MVAHVLRVANGHFQGRGGGGGYGKRRQHRDDPNNFTRYSTIVKENEKLEKNYNTILDLPEDERVEFWAALKRELPNSFRFCGSKGCVVGAASFFHVYHH